MKPKPQYKAIVYHPPHYLRAMRCDRSAMRDSDYCWQHQRYRKADNGREHEKS